MLEKTLESPLDCKEIQPVHPKGHQSWVFIGRTDVEAETPILWPPDVESWLIWKDPWCCERLRAGGEGDDRGWDGWMASPTQWTWVWVNFVCWWRTGRPGMLQSIGLQRVGHYWATELNWKSKGKWNSTLVQGNEWAAAGNWAAGRLWLLKGDVDHGPLLGMRVGSSPGRLRW